MLITYKAQVSNLHLYKRIFLLCASDCKLLAKIALFCRINKALLGIEIGINIISCISSICILVKNLQKNHKKVVTYFIANQKNY
jgi:hypothetical protein